MQKTRRGSSKSEFEKPIRKRDELSGVHPEERRQSRIVSIELRKVSAIVQGDFQTSGNRRFN